MPRNHRLLSSPYLLAADELRNNPEQWSAYVSTRDCVIIAGPGSGKTKTLTVKLAKILAEELPRPHGFACITYNSECAREITKRLKDLGVFRSDNIFVGTVHSFCFAEIVSPFAHLVGLDLPKSPRIAQRKDVQAALLESLTITNNAPQARDWKNQIDSYRKRHPDRNTPEWTQDDQELAEVIEAYERSLHKRGFIDFEEMVVNGLNLLKHFDWVRECIAARFPMIAVDEYQDLGIALHQIVLMLRGAGCRILAVGDADQSVYGFNEASPELLTELANQTGIELIKLRFNYRNGKNIVTASLAALGEHRDYVSTSESDGTIYFHECPTGIGEQANKACQLVEEILHRKAARNLGQIAIIYRNRFDGDVVAGACFANSLNNIRIDAGAAYPRLPFTRFLEDCACWCSQHWSCRGISAADLLSAWSGFITDLESRRTRESAKQALLNFLFAWKNVDAPLSEWLADFTKRLIDPILASLPSMYDQIDIMSELLDTATRGVLSNFDIARFAGQADDPDHVRLITFHSAKGLEFDAVIMVGLDQGAIPHYRSTSAKQLKQDRQLFYVGLTRARHEVHLLYSGFTEYKGSRFRNGRSRFIDEVEARLQAG